jgi:hypothetical protein
MPIVITIFDGSKLNEPPLIRMDSTHSITDPAAQEQDAALVARTMLQSAAYLFTQGQPVQFGAEVPREVLK